MSARALRTFPVAFALLLSLPSCAKNSSSDASNIVYSVPDGKAATPSLASSPVPVGDDDTLESELVPVSDPAPEEERLEVAELAPVEPSETNDMVTASPPKDSPSKAKRTTRARRRGDHAGSARMAMGRGAPPMAMAHGGPHPMEPQVEFDTEGYDHIEEPEFMAVADDPLSTFSIDVDTASYSNMRRFIAQGQLPPADAVRIEELINYFDYDYTQPVGVEPFSMNSEVSTCPWNEDHLLVHIGLQGKEIVASQVPTRNLVFLIDVSGSMESPDKLPLLQRGLAMLVETLRKQDRVSMVVYAGASGVVLEPTSDQSEILAALERLRAGGSTNGGAGIELAYAIAQRTFVKGGINRVVLATDGDFNVGISSQGELVRLIEDKRKSGVFLSVLGFGTGNVQDATMEQLADKGNGNYAYIDSLAEARKVLVEEGGSTLVTIAKDVKIQVEFNPLEVSGYRLVGYENRKLAHRDFNDDSKDAGEIGAGHTVTALYEVIPAGGKVGEVDALKYQAAKTPTKAATSGELMTVKVRYKQPDGNASKLSSFTITPSDRPLAATSNDYRFSAAVAEFGMLLRDSKHKGDSTFAEVVDLAQRAGSANDEHRREFLTIVEQASRLASTRQGG